MFGLSFTHLILLAVIVLVFIGPEQLPEVARTFARLFNEWKRASSEIQSSLTTSLKQDFQTRPADEKPTQAQIPDPHPASTEPAPAEPEKKS